MKTRKKTAKKKVKKVNSAIKSNRINKDQQITDRFFLEEIIFRLKNRDMEYVNTLLNDWMKEMIEKHPLTQRQRIKLIKSFFGKEAIGSSHFFSEVELKNHIGFVKRNKTSKK